MRTKESQPVNTNPDPAMNMLPDIFLPELNPILLQNVSNSFQMNLILYLVLSILVLTVVVCFVVYRALQVVLRASGLNAAGENVLTVDWVRYLFIVTMGLMLASLYLYAELT